MDPRYPAGTFSFDEDASFEKVRSWIDRIETLPRRLVEQVSGLNDQQLDSPYRKEGWTVRQVIHHLADSHLNAYCRLKLTLTEEHPVIRPYDQDRWAELEDSRLSPEVSIGILKGIHRRWATLLLQMEQRDFDRTFDHPESGSWTLKKHTAHYAWHGDHHLAHITTLKAQKNW